MGNIMQKDQTFCHENTFNLHKNKKCMGIIKKYVYHLLKSTPFYRNYLLTLKILTLHHFILCLGFISEFIYRVI